MPAVHYEGGKVQLILLHHPLKKKKYIYLHFSVQNTHPHAVLSALTKESPLTLQPQQVFCSSCPLLSDLGDVTRCEASSEVIWKPFKQSESSSLPSRRGGTAQSGRTRSSQSKHVENIPTNTKRPKSCLGVFVFFYPGNVKSIALWSLVKMWILLFVIMFDAVLICLLLTC